MYEIFYPTFSNEKFARLMKAIDLPQNKRTFISPTYYDKIDLPADSPLRNSMRILNPLGEDTSIMRTTTLPSMLEILARNYSFRNKAVKFYELGRTYFAKNDGSHATAKPTATSPAR